MTSDLSRDVSCYGHTRESVLCLTIGIELEHVEIRVCICYGEVELFAIGQEFCGNGFHARTAFSKEQHPVRFLL